MNETSILSCDIYGLVNHLSDWGCFDSRLFGLPVFAKSISPLPSHGSLIRSPIYKRHDFQFTISSLFLMKFFPSHGLWLISVKKFFCVPAAGRFDWQSPSDWAKITTTRISVNTFDGKWRGKGKDQGKVPLQLQSSPGVRFKSQLL